MEFNSEITFLLVLIFFFFLIIIFVLFFASFYYSSSDSSSFSLICQVILTKKKKQSFLQSLSRNPIIRKIISVEIFLVGLGLVYEDCTEHSVFYLVKTFGHSMFIFAKLNSFQCPVWILRTILCCDVLSFTISDFRGICRLFASMSYHAFSLASYDFK